MSDDTRTFHYADGASDKFWSIALRGTATAVQFGRLGTAGQRQVKEHGTANAARAAYDRLVAEKVKKGYVETVPGRESTPRDADDLVATEGTGDRAARSAAAPPSAEHTSATATSHTDATMEAATHVDAPEIAPVSTTPILSSPAMLTTATSFLSAPPEPQATAPAVEPRRSIALDPEDWYWATWRRLEPLRRPEPAPFDRNDALARLRQVKRRAYEDVGTVGYMATAGYNWSPAGIAPALTPDEARFWLRAMARVRDVMATVDEVADRLAREDDAAEFSLDDARAALGDDAESNVTPPPDILSPLVNLFPLATVIDLLIGDTRPRPLDWRWRQHYVAERELALAHGFRTFILPYLTVEEKEQARQRIRGALDPAAWPADHSDTPPLAFFLAATVGLHEELSALARGWSASRWGRRTDQWGQRTDWRDDSYDRPQEIVFGLGSAHAVDAEMRRLRLKLRTPEHVRAWLAHTEYAALDYVRDCILGCESKETAAPLLGAFALVTAPEAAPHMLQLMLASKAPEAARQWLDEHPAETVAGLIPATVGRDRPAEDAAEYLRLLRRRGFAPLLAAVLDRQPPEVAAPARAALANAGRDLVPFDAATTPDWLHAALSAVKAPAPSQRTTWIAADDLPSVAVDGRRLADAQVTALLDALAQSTLEAPHPLVLTLKAHADHESIDLFARRLCEAWLIEGAPPRADWALKAVGLLGGDASALKLTPLVRAWPGENYHQRAELGLECLRAIGSDGALMAIGGIAQKLKFKGLQAKARAAMEDIARARGLTRAQLEDRVVPDCDLDERGSRTFDLGGRRFTFTLGAGLTPLLRDERGAPRPALPKPTAKDDPALVARAAEDWKLLKKEVAEVAKIQAVRLEQAMVTGRRWTPTEFETLLARHPLMTHLARLLIWGRYDGGALTATFRLTEDSGYADSKDEPFALDDKGTIGVVHPLRLSADERSAWGEILSDYETVPPFPQLSRPLYYLEPDEAAAQELARYKDVKIAPQTLVYTLERLDWVRGTPRDGSIFDEHSKPFESAGVTAVLTYRDGVPVGYIDDWDDQTLDACVFARGITGPSGFRRYQQLDMVPPREVDSVVISEVLGDLTVVAAKRTV